MALKTDMVTVAVPAKKPRAPEPPPEPRPVEPGQIVYVSVLPKPDLRGDYSDCSPELFSTMEAALADCERLNKSRSEKSQFVVRTMRIRG